MLHSYRLYLTPQHCLDEEFDAPDAAADHDLCQAIVAGKAGLHSDAWDNHDVLTTLPPRYRRPFVPPVGYPGDNAIEWKPHTPKPRPSRPLRIPSQEEVDNYLAPASGNVQLTCDDCQARYRLTMYYRDNRPHVVQSIRLMGKTDGWTCILGRDRCPGCSHIPPPEDVGHGAGERQGDEQHG